jgi:hypothetical protein
MRAVSPIRWCHSGLAAAVLLAFALRGPAQDIKPDIEQEMKAAFRESFVYAPKAADAPVAKPATDVVLLRRVIVHNRWESQGLDSAIARQDAIDDRFTLYNGGALATRDTGKGRFDAGTWYAGTGLGLLKYSW